VRDEGQFDQRKRREDRDKQSNGSLSWGDRAAVLAERPRDRQQREHAERRLQLKHDSPEAGEDYGGRAIGCAMMLV